MIDVEPVYFNELKSILKKYFRNKKILIYGSRAKGNAHHGSDIDIAVFGDSVISIEKLSFIDEEFSESDIPYTVNLVDAGRIDDSFRQVIIKEGVPCKL